MNITLLKVHHLLRLWHTEHELTRARANNMIWESDNAGVRGRIALFPSSTLLVMKLKAKHKISVMFANIIDIAFGEIKS